MDSLLLHLGLGLAAILAIGFVTGRNRLRAEAGGGLSPWLGWGLIAFALGLVVAGVGALPGRAGLWLDLGLAAYAAFLIGCAAGALGRAGNLREHREWALGLLPATLLWLVASAVEIPRIEAARREAAAPPTDARAIAERRAPAAADPKAEFLESARRQAETLARSQAAQRADPEGGSGADRTGSVSVQNLTLQQRAARLEAARAYLAKLPASGALELPVCQQALDASQRVSKALFAPGSYEITRAAAAALDQLTPVLRRCPDAKVEIAGHTDNVGAAASNLALSRLRAEAVLRYLVAQGVPAARLSAAGYGAQQPIASNDDEPGRADNRRIEFVLK